MIRTGRAEAWLREPIEGFPRWANFNGIRFAGIKIGPLPGFEHRGSTVIADSTLVCGEAGAVLTVPKELIVSRQNVELIAKSDKHLRELLQSLDEFGRVRPTSPHGQVSR